MKYKLLKQKAVFQIFLILSLTFYSSLSLAAINPNPKVNYLDLISQDFIPNVDAQNPVKYCCQKTKTNSEFQGASCVYTVIEDCDLTAGNPVALSCEQTDYCRPSCCINNNGQCEDNVEATICISNNGVARPGACSEILQCKVGCCNLPSGSSLTTQSQCAAAIQNYPNLNLQNIFDPNIQDEQQCIQQSLGTEEGCCRLPDSCSFGTRAECSNRNGEFFLNTICSYPSLGCPVTSKHHTQCYQGKVYWYDSSNNRENVYGTQYRQDGLLVLPKDSCTLNLNANGNDIRCGNCDFSLGSICSDATTSFKNELRSSGLSENEINKINNQCVSLDCKITQPSKTYQGQKINPWMGGAKKNGEAWCEYEGITGEGKDLVGSRHYRHVCLNGREIIEECQTERKEYCVQGEIPTQVTGLSKPYSTAKCITNNWPVCSEANQQETCNLNLDDVQIKAQCDASPGECKILQDAGRNAEYIDCCTKQLCRKQSCEDFVPDCYWNDAVKLCAPNVPPGTLVRSNQNDNPQLDEEGNLFKYECKEYWKIDGPEAFYDWDCIGNCKSPTEGACYQQATVDAWNSYCRSLGDYGAHYNVAARYSKGFTTTFPKGYESSDDDLPRIKPPNPTELHFRNFAIAAKALNGGPLILLSIIDYIGSRLSLNPGDYQKNLWKRWAGSELGGSSLWINVRTAGGLIAVSAIGSFLEGSVPFFTSLGLKAGSVLSAFTEFGHWSTIGAYFSGEGVVSSALGVVAGVLIIAQAIALAYLVVTFIFALYADERELTYTYTCLPWTPPGKGLDCEKCNTDFQTCDKYKCESLGKACEAVDTQGNITCVWKNKGDTTAPIRSLLVIAPRTQSNYQVFPSSNVNDGGYLVKGLNNENILPAYGELTVGIKTNERATCKITRFAEKSYNDIPDSNIFGSQLSLEHKMIIRTALTGINPDEDRIESQCGKENIFYVKCEDVNENQNQKAYFIKFNTGQCSDTTPPIIREFSIPNGAFIPYNLNRTLLSIYIYDEQPIANGTFVNACRYSTVDQSYELMPFNTTCLQGRVRNNLFQCSTELKLNPNQENTFYFRCTDLSNNINRESQPVGGYKLKPSSPLKITRADPTGRYIGTIVNLSATTEAGAENGKAICYYSTVKAFAPSSIKFTSTNSNLHSTTIPLENEKDYKFFIGCRDIAGNEASTSIEFHTTTPDLNITSASPDNEVINENKFQLKVTTVGGIHNNGDSTCSYSGGINGFFNEDKQTLADRTIQTKNITLQPLQNTLYYLNITCTDQYKSDKKQISFTINTATYPKIVRVYRQGNLLNVLVDQPAECRYSTTNPNFDFEQTQLKMVADSTNKLQSVQISSSLIYIKCKDLNTRQLSPTYTIYP